MPVFAQDGLVFEDQSPKNRYKLVDGVLTISSRTGIGTVAVRPADGEHWPAWTAVRFEYLNGQGMKVLEGLWVRGDETAPRDNYLDLRPNIVDGALLLKLPEELLAGTNYVEIHWVDFYRH